MIKAILFDMDGVLIDSYEAWYQLFNFTLNSFGLKKASRALFSEKAWAQDFDIVTKRFFKGKSVEDISKAYFSNFINFKKYLKKILNVEFVLKELKKRKIKRVVVTNTYHDIAVELLTALGLLKYFDIVIGGDDVKCGKPAPDMILKACNELKVASDDVFMVGDTEWDGITAKRAGCFFVGYKTEGNKKIEDLKELLEMV